MEFVEIDREGSVGILTLRRGGANPINAAFQEEIHGAVEELSADSDVRAVVIGSASDKFFSAGFDVAEVFTYDREAMGRFFGAFMDLYHAIVRCPKPTVAAVSGHAYAAGTIIALACDERVFARGKFGFALNEINLGVVIPPGVAALTANAMGPQHARKFLVSGASADPEMALAWGAADALVELSEVRSVALERAAELAKKPPEAVAGLKAVLADSIGIGSLEEDRAFLERFLDHWFSEESAGLRAKLAESVKR